MEGRIKWFDADRGFGFIGAEGHEDFFFPRGEFQGSTPIVGLAVEFEVAEGNRARNVRPAEDPEVYGVADFLHAMNAALTARHPEVTVEGEVASVRSYKDFILFFELKEEGAKLNCFIKKDLVPDLVEGTRIRAIGTPNVTPKSAEVRLKARAVEFVGEGALKRAVELLRRRLDEEGLFAIERKRSLPTYPSAIGLVTAIGCDGDMDFRTKLSQRWPHATVYLASVQVQGAAAPEEIAGALAYFNQGAAPVEALVIVQLPDLMTGEVLLVSRGNVAVPGLEFREWLPPRKRLGVARLRFGRRPRAAPSAASCSTRRDAGTWGRCTARPSRTPG